MVEWDVESRLARVRWRRGGHMADLSVVAPDIGEVAKAHAIAMAGAVDAILVAQGFYDFPQKGGVTPAPAPAEATGKVLSVAVFDANPIYSPDGRTLPQDLKPTQLIAADTGRKGTSADGVSRLIVRAEVSEDVPVEFELEAVAEDTGAAPLGELTPLLEGRTVTLRGRHYAFALYTPPERFDPPVDVAAAPNSPLLPPGVRLDSGLEIREIQVWAAIAGGGGSEFADIVLARPPWFWSMACSRTRCRPGSIAYPTVPAWRRCWSGLGSCRSW